MLIEALRYLAIFFIAIAVIKFVFALYLRSKEK